MEEKEYLTLTNINKYFGKFHVLKNINLSIKKGEFICLLGPSGCGKTSLLRTIAGLEREDSGELKLENKNWRNFSTKQRNIGIVFQSYALFPNMTGEENITFGLKSKGLKETVITETLKEVVDLIQLDGIAKKYPSQMSGGQQQRIALGRAIAMKPDILLLDEPLSALDAKVRVKLRNEIKELQKKLKITTIMVTHDQEEALSMGDRIVVMNEGKIEQIGTPEEIYNFPNNKFVANFIGTVNFIYKDGKELIVRPENIVISNLKNNESKTCIIRNIEFKGNGYRLRAEEKGNGSVKEFIIDLSSKEFKRLNKKEDESIEIDLKESKFTFLEEGNEKVV